MSNLILPQPEVNPLYQCFAENQILQALIKQKAYFQEIEAKQQMGFQKQMMEFLQSKRIHE